MVEYWNNGLKEGKAGETAFPGFTLVSSQPNIPTFHYSILPNVTGAPKKMEIPIR